MEEQKAALEPLCRLIKDILGDKVCTWHCSWSSASWSRLAFTFIPQPNRETPCLHPPTHAIDRAPDARLCTHRSRRWWSATGSWTRRASWSPASTAGPPTWSAS
jgi:hypothetical protein